MMMSDEKNINTLFEQLGLDGSDASIEEFVKTHQLPSEVKLSDAAFWNDNQRKFLKEEYQLNAVWVEAIDDLNARLHIQASKNDA